MSNEQNADNALVAGMDESFALASLPRVVRESLTTKLVELPRSRRELVITHPGAIDPLLDLVLDDPEQNLPYWAEIWPSGIALGDRLALEPALVAGKSVLELGCGVGVTAVAAMMAGAALLATDYARASLVLCAANCAANGVARPALATVNWRRDVSVHAATAGACYDVVLAADVLYERRDVEPLLQLLPTLLAPSGVLLLAEPGRPPAALFLNEARKRGWHIASTTHDGPWPDPADHAITVGLHTMRLT